MVNREPLSASDAIQQGKTILVTPLIANAVEEAKWLALSFEVKSIYQEMFPDKDVPKSSYQPDPILQSRDHIVAMLVEIQRQDPPIAGMILEAAASQDIILDESVVAERRAHLKVVSDVDEGAKMQQDQSGPVPE